MQPAASLAFPDYSDAPIKLLAMNGNCGLLATWAVLKHFRKRINVDLIIKNCAYTRRYGVFTIGIACALAEAGLAVQFYSAVDPNLKSLERRLYRRASQLGVEFHCEIRVMKLVQFAHGGSIPIVFYDTDAGVGHFSPLLGIDGQKLALPYDDAASMPIHKFKIFWRAPGIYKQAVVAKPA